jgi:hypothetical protein
MKTRTVLLVLIVAAVLVTTAGSTASQARASTTVSNVVSGGQYVLTIQTTAAVRAATRPTGYRLSDAAPAVVDPAAGCCCKTNLPCVRK